MQMIDVLKRLAELDATNPNVVPAKTTIKESAIEECGPMGMMAPEPKTPATINITAGDGEELGNMLAAIMQLAGVHKVEPEHLGVEPEPAAITAEPAMSATPTAGDDMRAVLDKLHPETDGEEEEGDEEETDESAVNRPFDNSPEEEDEGYDAFTDHGDMAKNPAMGGDTAKNHDTRSRVRNQPTATMEEQLMAEYKQFIAEDMDNEEYVACIVDYNRSGQAVVRRTKPCSKQRCEEIISNAKAKNTFTNPPFMTIYPASAGKLDGEAIMKQFPDMSKEDSKTGTMESEELDIDSFTNGNEPNFTGRDEEDFDKAQKMFVNFLKKKGKAVDSINDDAFPVLIAMC